MSLEGLKIRYKTKRIAPIKIRFMTSLYVIAIISSALSTSICLSWCTCNMMRALASALAGLGVCCRRRAADPDICTARDYARLPSNSIPSDFQCMPSIRNSHRASQASRAFFQVVSSCFPPWLTAFSPFHPHCQAIVNREISESGREDYYGYAHIL